MSFTIGTDLLDVRRMARVWKRHPHRLIHRLLTPAERIDLEKEKDPPLFLAKVMAMKEACIKALSPQRVTSWQDMHTWRTPYGKPMIQCSLKGWGLEVSLSDEPPYVQAVVLGKYHE